MANKPQLHTLPNGIRVVLDQCPTKTCAIRVCFPFMPDVNGAKGLAHFCEHMICNSGAQFPDGIHSDGLSGCHLNGWTYYNGVMFGGEMLPRRAKLVLDVISDGLKNRLFRPDVLERERNAVRDEFYRGEHDFIITDIYPGVSNDKSLNDYVIGTVDSIDSFTNEQVVDFIQRNFTKSNCIVILSGNFEPDIVNYIGEKFDCLPDGPIEPRISPLFPYTSCKMKFASPTARRTSVAAVSAIDSDIAINRDNRYKWACHQVLFDWLRHNMRIDLRRLVYTSRLVTMEDVSKILLIMMAECQSDKKQVQDLYSQMAQTCYRALHTDKITKRFIDDWRQNERFNMAQLLSNSSRRCEIIAYNIMRHFCVTNWSSDMKMLRQLKRSDIIENTRDVFSPDKMSYAIKGQDFGLDLKTIWAENFRSKIK
ncbi:MAG: insulinase family protein [Muribaculaceae bacterium]|nr:insulinase family protein [Muribaculaceae bacterium]